MAKKKKAPKPDVDGILDTGIYRRDCRPRKGVSPHEYLKIMEERILKSPPRPTIHQWLDQYLEYFASFLRPHVKPAGPGGSWRLLNMGDGWRGYQVADDIDEPCRDAIEGMDTIDTLQRQFNAKKKLDRDLAKVIQASYKLGEIVERIWVRQHEHSAKVGKDKINQFDNVRVRKGISKELRAQAIRAIQQAKIDSPDRRNDIDYIKKRAADSLGISKRALNLRLKK